MNGINPIYIQGYATSIMVIINAVLVPVLISIAFIVFLWGIYNYFILGADNETKRTEGKTFSLYGIIGFVIMFSVWGIVQIFMGTLGLSSSNAPSFPTIGGITGTSPTGTYFSGFPGAGTAVGTSGTFVGDLAGGGQTQALTTEQSQVAALSQAYSSYNTCEGQYGSSDSRCQALLSKYTQLSNSSGSVATCGTNFTSVCSPGSTCTTTLGVSTCKESACNPFNGETFDPLNPGGCICMAGWKDNSPQNSATIDCVSPNSAAQAAANNSALEKDYRNYEQCVANPDLGSGSSVCKDILAKYEKDSAATGNVATCGTFSKSTCGPGATCSLGFCQESTCSSDDPTTTFNPASPGSCMCIPGYKDISPSNSETLECVAIGQTGGQCAGDSGDVGTCMTISACTNDQNNVEDGQSTCGSGSVCCTPYNPAADTSSAGTKQMGQTCTDSNQCSGNLICYESTCAISDEDPCTTTDGGDSGTCRTTCNDNESGDTASYCTNGSMCCIPD